MVKAAGGVFQINVNAGGKSQSWTLDLKNGNGSVSLGAAPKADVTLTFADEDFVQVMTGKMNAQDAFMKGKLKTAGNMGLAMKLGNVLKQAKL